ncbi:MAG: hypothetical protein K2L42_07055, partial [Clostridia bacterium]|nr:hypothetical protein [Clostridia bacterium]
MKKYFLYELRKSAPAIAFLTLAMTVWYLSQILFFAETSLNMFFANVVTVITFAGFVAALAPVKTFSYRTKKRSVDLFYALPLSHKKILAVKFLVGLVVIYLPYTVAFFIGSAATAATAHEANAAYCIPLYFASLIPIYIIYSISSFAFTRANKRNDGVLFIIFWFTAVPLVLQVLDRICGACGEPTTYFGSYIIDSGSYAPTSPLTIVTEYFGKLIFPSTGELYPVFEAQNEAVRLANLIAGLTVNSLLSIGATVGLFLLEKKTRAENAEQISESLFGYKTMIPLITACALALCISRYTALNVVVVVIIVLVASAICMTYRRTVKIGWKQLIILGISIAVGIITGGLLFLKKLKNRARANKL